MKAIETTKNNILLATFEGLPMLSKEIFTRLNDQTGSTDFVHKTQLRYEINWNWLMQVVAKIEDIRESKDNQAAKYNFLQEQCFVEIIENTTSDTIVREDADTKIQATYKAVVKFIEWYNRRE